MADRFLGASRPRFAAALIGLLILGLAVAGLAITGQFSDLRHANIPWIHPYPPSGYELNPLNPGNKDDLINLAAAQKVKADLLADGRIETDALAAGDTSALGNAATGGALDAMRRLIQTNNSQGLVEKTETDVQTVVAGRLPDPNNPSITWCVQESGSGTLTYAAKATGAVVRTQSVRFRSRYWLTRAADGRYVIADSFVTLT